MQLEIDFQVQFSNMMSLKIAYFDKFTHKVIRKMRKNYFYLELYNSDTVYSCSNNLLYLGSKVRIQKYLVNAYKIVYNNNEYAYL